MKTFEDLLKDYDYILEIKHPKYNCIGWEEKYLDGLKDWATYKFIDNSIEYCGEEFGTYQFVRANEVTIPTNYPKLDCQFNNFNHGFFCFELDPYNQKIDMEDIEYFIIANIKESMGVFIGIDDEKEVDQLNYYPCVAIKQYDINLGKYSFNDGSDLLSREDESYCKYVIEELSKSFTSIGLNVWISTKISCHNPFDYFYIQIEDNLFPTIFSLENEGKIVDYDTVSKLLLETYCSILAYNFSIVTLITQKWVVSFDD